MPFISLIPIMPEVEYDWELNSLTIDGEEWRIYLQNTR